MPKLRFFMIISMSLLLVLVYACNKNSNEGETTEISTHEHETGEEAGPQISKDGIHDEIRKGVRLILSFDNEFSSFTGTIENITEKTIYKVRVEVHLSNGKELGPTPPIDLAPGKKVNVGLSAEGQSFNWWKAHAEAGESDH